MSSLNRWIERFSLYVALAAAWTAMLGSLYFSEIKAYVPCDLCWYQRILMYPLTLILAIGISVRDKWIPRIVLPLSVIGMTIAGYHYLLEKTDLFAKDAFCRAGVSCVTVWINWFGFITIPFLSFTAFTIITIMCIIAILGGEPRQTSDDDEDGEESLTATGGDAAVNEDSEEDSDDDFDPALERAWPGRPWTLVLAIIGVIVVIFACLFYSGLQERARASALVAAMEAPLTVGSVSGEMTPITQTVGVTSTEVIAESPEIAAGHALYSLTCASCHGASGEGVAGLGSTLTASDFVAAHTDAELLDFIREGRDVTSPENTTGLVMPASGGNPNLTESDLQAIILYLRSIQ